MTLPDQRLADYIVHIIEAIDRIERYLEDIDELAFCSSELVQDAVIRNLDIVGEACHNIARNYPHFASANPGLPLAAAYQMRNVLAHGYFKVDLALVWNTTQTALPLLRDQLLALRRDASNN